MISPPASTAGVACCEGSHAKGDRVDIPKTRWAKTIDGANIAYQEFGQGSTTLVVIHGWLSNIDVYWEQPRFARFMRRLSRNYHVVHFDKRGVGLSERITEPPTLEAQMDDVRAVVEAVGAERVALLAWGGTPQLAVVYGATHPDRTIAMCLGSLIHQRRDADFPWGWTAEENEATQELLMSGWGDEDHALDLVHAGFGDRPGDAPVDDPAFLAWIAKLARSSATPLGLQAFDRMWFDTDVRDILSAVHVPAAVLLKTDCYEADRGMAQYMVERIRGCRLIEVPGTAETVWVEDPEPYVSAVEEFIASALQQEAELDRVLATVVFTDIVGSTETAARLGDHAWKQLLQRHHATVRALLARYRGVEVDTAGDGFLATFDGPARAVKCAEGICEAVKPLGLEVRAGCHTGEIEVVGDGVGGLAVHIAARVAAKAKPSEVLVSSTVKDLVAGTALSFADRGNHALKGVPGRWKLFACQQV